MAQVNLNINNKKYPIACDDGQEDRVHELATQIDTRVKEITAAGLGTRNDSHALVLAALMMADEMDELRRKASFGKKPQAEQPKSTQATTQGSKTVEKIVYKDLAPEDEQLIVGAIEHLTGRIDGLAKRMENA